MASPDAQPAARRQSLLGAAACVVAGTAAAAALVARDPHATGSFGTCPSLWATGLYCPGCGSLRGLHDLLTGAPLEAVGHNLLLLPALAWLAWWWGRLAAAGAGRTMPGPPSSARFSYALLTVLVLFTVLRNLPGSPLAP